MAKKFKLGIVSNFCGNLHIILEENQIRKYFDFVLDSYHVGFKKPEPEIFELALAKTGVLSERVIFVGDNLWRDIHPAKELGMKTAWITSFSKTNHYADFNILTLEELLQKIQIK